MTWGPPHVPLLPPFPITSLGVPLSQVDRKQPGGEVELTQVWSSCESTAWSARSRATAAALQSLMLKIGDSQLPLSRNWAANSKYCAERTRVPYGV